MPFTPVHMGPGLLLKAVGGRCFSVLAFGVAQVAMDLEPLIGLFRGARVLHGWTHTYLAATLIAPVAMVAAAMLVPLIRERWDRELHEHHVNWLATEEPVGNLALATGAFVGTYSHVALDSILYTDIAPLAPWSTANWLHGRISFGELHLACLIAGLLGLTGWVIAGFSRKGRIREAGAP